MLLSSFNLFGQTVLEAGIVNGFVVAQQVFLNFKKNPTSFLHAVQNTELLGFVFNFWYLCHDQ